MGRINDSLHRQYGAQRIRHLSDRDQDRTGIQQAQELIENELPARVDGRDLECAARLLAEHLPGNDVRVMLQAGDQDLVAGLEARPPISLGDQIDGLCGATHKDDLARGASIDELPDSLPGSLERLGRRLAERMDAPVDIGMRVGLVRLDRTQHRERPL